jgi:lysozyme
MAKIVEFLVHGEGLRLKAYRDSGGVWTIGIGSTYYADGTKVKEGDVITLEAAYTLAETVAIGLASFVSNNLKVAVTENQLIALISFCYNIGRTAFKNSSVLKMVNVDPNDPLIRTQFLKSFVTAGGIPSAGLVNRRKSEANKYFS